MINDKVDKMAETEKYKADVQKAIKELELKTQEKTIKAKEKTRIIEIIVGGVAVVLLLIASVWLYAKGKVSFDFGSVLSIVLTLFLAKLLGFKNDNPK